MIDAQHAEKRPNEALGLSEWQTENGSERQRGLNRVIRIESLPTWDSRRLRNPVRDRSLAEPDRDIAASAKSLLVLPPIPDAILCLVARVDETRFHCGHAHSSQGRIAKPA